MLRPVSVVWIFERTSVFQFDFAAVTRLSRGVPEGISESTNWHALAGEMKEIPTRDETLAWENENTAPTYRI